MNFARVLAALGSLGVAETDSRCVWAVLAAIYHLGVAGAIRGPNNKVVFVRPAAAQRAATLLGRSSLEELAQLVFHASPTLQGSSALLMNGRPSFRTGSPVSGSKDLAQADKNLDPAESLEGFVQGLYVEAFNALVALINKYERVGFIFCSSFLTFFFLFDEQVNLVYRPHHHFHRAGRHSGLPKPGDNH